MKSNKTEVLSFEDVVRNCTWKAHSDDYYRGFEAGQQSKQAEIDELQKRVKELELINFDSELHFDAAKEHIDCLQERIDEVIFDLQHIESAMWEEQVEHVLMILKGDQA